MPVQIGRKRNKNSGAAAEERPRILHPRSIEAFCERLGICRASFYNHKDKMPVVTRVGARTIITETAEREWEHRSAQPVQKAA